MEKKIQYMLTPSTPILIEKIEKSLELRTRDH
jgi:hypothetical protein